ncbi:serine/threonine-protein kinase [Microbacterium aureliae]
MTDASLPPDHVTGETLDGRYRLIERIGEGGMARVYRAEDTALGRTVAIKVLRGPSGDLQVIERARSETTLLASLNHHALVTLYDARIDDDAGGYLVMEYVDGITLRDLMARGPVEPRELAGIATDLAEALQYAHDAGIVHRDIKPGNVLLSASPRPDREWRAKLADFGIAHLLDSDRVTTPGLIVGTMAYLAPEQARGAAPAPSADIYAFGLMLLEALTGSRAFGDAEGMAAVTARLAAPPVIPETVAPAWHDLLRRMTAMIPADRPTAIEVALAVEQARSADAGAPGSRDTAVTRVMPAGLAASGMPPLPAVPAAVAAAGIGAAAGAAANAAAGPGAGATQATTVLEERAGAAAAGAAPASARTRSGGLPRRAALIAGAIALLLVLGVVLAVLWAGSLAPAPATTPTPTSTATPTPTPTPEPEPAPPADDDGDDDGGNDNSGPGNNSGNNGDDKGKGKGKNKDD